MNISRLSYPQKIRPEQVFNLLDTRMHGMLKQGGRCEKTIIFHGASGGVGTTTLAGETAIYLAAAGYKTVALDLNLFCGSLHYKLDVPDDHDSYTISDIIPVIDDLDDRTAENALSRSPFGPWVLPAPATCAEAEKVRPPHLKKLVAFFSEKFQKVVIDTSPGLDASARVLHESGGLVVLTIVPDIFCVGRAYRFLKDLDLCFDPVPEVRIILNRTAGSRDPLPAGDIESFLGRSISAVIPDETSTCRQLSCQGRQVRGSKTGVGQSIDSALRKLFPPV